MCVSFSLVPVIWTRLLAVVNARSSHSLLYCVCARVCVFPSASLSQCVGTWAAKLLHGLIDFMPSSHIYSHLLSDSPPSSRSSSFSFGPLPMAMVHLGNRRLSRKWEAAWWEEDLPWVLCKAVTWRGGLQSAPAGGVRGRWWGACSLQAWKSGGSMLNIPSIHVLLRGRKQRIKSTQSKSCCT